MTLSLLEAHGSMIASQSTDESIQTSPAISKNNHTVDTKDNKINKPVTYKWEIAWRNVIAFLILHTAGLYGGYLFLFECRWITCFTTYLMGMIIGQGITTGAHRLWAHRAYKAKLPLRIILMVLQTMAFQNHIYEWVRDHRVHHKFTDTNADPHNAKRGFFFSHIGWLMIKKHKDVITKGKTVDMSDLEADPVVAFQKKYYLAMVPIFCFVIPTLITYYFCGEDLWTAFFVTGMFRYMLGLNFTWLVNSAAHLWGIKPYDKNIGPAQNLFVAAVALGEGWHNYHHVFPWDYKTAELGNYGLNFSTMVIDFLAIVGWAYDLKTVSKEMIDRRVKRTGDGSRPVTKEYDFDDQDEHHQGEVWGWGDTDMKEEDIREATIYNASKED